MAYLRAVFVTMSLVCRYLSVILFLASKGHCSLAAGLSYQGHVACKGKLFKPRNRIIGTVSMLLCRSSGRDCRTVKTLFYRDEEKDQDLWAGKKSVDMTLV